MTRLPPRPVARSAPAIELSRRLVDVASAESTPPPATPRRPTSEYSEVDAERLERERRFLTTHAAREHEARVESILREQPIPSPVVAAIADHGARLVEIEAWRRRRESQEGRSSQVDRMVEEERAFERGELYRRVEDLEKQLSQTLGRKTPPGGTVIRLGSEAPKALASAASLAVKAIPWVISVILAAATVVRDGCSQQAAPVPQIVPRHSAAPTHSGAPPQ